MEKTINSESLHAGRKPPRIIVAKTKHDCQALLGQFANESHYDVLIEEDCDIYAPADCDPSLKTECEPSDDCAACTRHNAKDELKIIAKFRKNWFSQEEQDAAYEGLRLAATTSQNRGLAAGPREEKLNNRDWVTEYQFAILDCFLNPGENVLGEDPVEVIKDEFKRLREDSSRGRVWKTEFINKIGFVFDKWVEEVRNLPTDERLAAAKIVDSYISDTTYANQVFSGVAGYFDRYPRIPYLRETSYTKNHYESFKKAFPFLQTLNQSFKEMMPWRWNNQYGASKKIDPRYLVPGTVFTTITVNKTFRTACHFDAGDLHTGLSNLMVLSNGGNYTGGYLIAPEYRVAINVRPGDLLLINNHEVLHGNTPIVLGDENAERISIVCYLREGMMTGTPKEYEDLRFEFIESRRLNPAHPLQRNRWNGISPNCFSDSDGSSQDWEAARDWYEFLNKSPGGNEFLVRFHPWLLEHFEGISLSDFFED